MHSFHQVDTKDKAYHYLLKKLNHAANFIRLSNLRNVDASLIERMQSELRLEEQRYLTNLQATLVNSPSKEDHAKTLKVDRERVAKLAIQKIFKNHSKLLEQLNFELAKVQTESKVAKSSPAEAQISEETESPPQQRTPEIGTRSFFTKQTMASEKKFRSLSPSGGRRIFGNGPKHSHVNVKKSKYKKLEVLKNQMER